MTVCSVPDGDPQTGAAAETVNFKDILQSTHGELDKNAVSVWVQLIREFLGTPAASASGTSCQDGVLVLQKLMFNYSHLHQLPRLFNKFVQALRIAPDDDHHFRVFPMVLFSELRNAFADAPESQLANVFGLFLKELAEYLAQVESHSNGAPCGKMKVIARVLWILLKHLRIKNTTRQETLQSVWKLYSEMQDTVIGPILQLCEKSRDADLIYTCVILVHSWSNFPLVFTDRLDVSTKSSVKYVKSCISTLRGLATALDRGDLKFWFQQANIQYHSISSRHGWTENDAAEFFCWDTLNAATQSSVWDGNVFGINAESLPVALWSSICTHYPHLLVECTPATDVEFGDCLVRFWLHFNGSTGGDSTLFTVSDKFLKNGSAIAKPTLRAACLKSVETVLRDSFETEHRHTGKKTKKAAKREDVQVQCRLFRRVFELCRIVVPSLDLGHLDFSISLLWKAMEFILENKGSWTSDVHGADSLPYVQKLFIDVVTSVPTRDTGYWENVVIDFARIRPKLLDVARTCSPAVLTACLEVYHEVNLQLLTRIIDGGGAASLGSAKKNVDSVKNLDAGDLTTIFLEVLSTRMSQPQCAVLFDQVVPSTIESFTAAASDFFEANEKATIVEVHRLSFSAGCWRIILKKLRAVQFLQSRLSNLAESLTPHFSTKRANFALDLLEQTDDVIKLGTALKWLCLHIEVTQHCSLKMARRIINSLTPLGSELEGVDVRSSSETDIEETDKVLLEQLHSILEEMKVKIPGDQVGSREAAVLSLYSLSDHSQLFQQARLFAKPVKFSMIIQEAISAFVKLPPTKANILWELSFIRLIVTSHLTFDLAKQSKELYERILERLSSTVWHASSELRTASAFMVILSPLLSSSYALPTCTVALSESVFRLLLNRDLSDADFTVHFQNCTLLLNDILKQSRLITPQTVPSIIKAASLWLISIIQRARQDSDVGPAGISNRKPAMIRNASFVERLLGNLARHQRFFSKLIVHLIAVYCLEVQNGTLYPEAKEHITAGLYRLLDMIDPHSRQMGNASIGVESREIYKTLLEEHSKFHKYRGHV